jgi:predicted XRE-type DNA-binding protein
MKKTKPIVAKDAGQLAEALGLARADGIEFAVRSALNAKILEVARKKKLTHAQVASLCGTSRTRITAIMNRNTKDVSTDLMLRVLGALGVSARVTFGRAASDGKLRVALEAASAGDAGALEDAVKAIAHAS